LNVLNVGLLLCHGETLTAMNNSSYTQRRRPATHGDTFHDRPAGARLASRGWEATPAHGLSVWRPLNWAVST